MAVRQAARPVICAHFPDSLTQPARRFRIDCSPLAPREAYRTSPTRQRGPRSCFGLVRSISHGDIERPTMKPAASPIESILAAAVEIDSAPERRAFIDEACAGDA